MHRPMWEKGGIIYSLHRSIQIWKYPRPPPQRMKQLHCCTVRQFHITQNQFYFLILKNPALSVCNRGNQNQVKEGMLLQDMLVEYAYRQLSGEKAPTFHKLLFVHAEDTSAGVLRATMLQKGFDLILVPSIGEAKRRIFEDKEIDLILCDVELPDGTAMELFHTLRRGGGGPSAVFFFSPLWRQMF